MEKIQSQFGEAKVNHDLTEGYLYFVGGYRQTFQSHPVFFVPGTNAAECSWRSYGDVFWDGPRSLVSKAILQRLYPGLETFFRMKLRITAAPADALVQDMIYLSTQYASKGISDDLKAHFSLMLADIGGLLLSGDFRLATPQRTCLAKLQNKAIFPFKHPVHGLRLGKCQDFYVPDTSGKLADAFANKLPFLSIHPPSLLSRMQPIFQCPLWDFRPLENFAICTTKVGGTPVVDKEETKHYLAKLGYIERYVFVGKITSISS